MENQTDTTTPETESAPSLGLQDLVLMAQIIQLATSRASWKPDELSVVGNLYDRLMSFLESSGAVKKSDQPVESETSSGLEETQNA
jgi:hypothetical protein